jgi:carboxyl-terminal processing protease
MDQKRIKGEHMTMNVKQVMKSGFLVLCTAVIVVSATVVYGDLKKANDETYEGLKLFSDVISEIEKNYVEPVNTKDLIQKAIEGMVQSLDPHSSFLPPEAYEDLQTETKGEFGGIGIVITQRDGNLTVISPIEGTPAYKAGVLAQDIIIKVDGESTKGMMLWEAVKKMRGKPGTTVDIAIFRKGSKSPLEFKLVRDVIPLDSVRSLTVKPGYGYLWITNFRENTAAEVTDALKKLEKENAPLKGLILDLRDNPGGLLDQAVKVSDIFLKSGTIVSIKGREESQAEVYTAHEDADAINYPIVLLINGGSASASEIVAGALQDNHRALILGTTSFGKGSVQTVKPLRDGCALKYTIALYYTPSGRSIQAEGIKPDLIVKRQLLVEDAKDGIDSNLIKEQDLKNHLEVDQMAPEPDTINEVPAEDTDKKGNQTEQEDVMRLRDAVYEHSEKAPETLMRDSQVNRAYEILKGYEIFHGITKN